MSNALTLDQINAHGQNTMIGNLGIEFIHISEAYVEATMPVDKRTTQSFGYLHGGASIALAETLAGIGTINLVLPKQRCVGMQISASHVSSALKGDSVIAKGNIIHKGRTSHIWDVNIYSQSTHKLISSIRVTNAIVSNNDQQLSIA